MEANTRRVVQSVVAIVLVALAALSLTFFVAGLHHNENASSLRRHGVAVSVTVATCDGELGGSGSNLADYRCEGTFTLRGHRFHDVVPGNSFRPTGSKATFITSTNSPSLLVTSLQAQNERATWDVFILPLVLFGLLAISIVTSVRRRLWKK